MNQQELKDHLDYIDGVQKAQMIAIRGLLRDRPDVKVVVRQYADQLIQGKGVVDLTPIQLESLIKHLLAISQ